MKRQKPSVAYKLIKGLLRLCYPKMEVVGTENLPDEPVVIVANHSQMHGPIACELYMPIERYTWCAGQMMQLKEVPAYAYKDFWSYKSRWAKPFYKILSYVIAPLSVLIFCNAQTIGVYRDSRIVSTFKNTVSTLCSGKSVVVFPEQDVAHNNILFAFQDKFIDVARLYYKKTGKELAFVPMYIAPRLHKMYLGEPVRFQSDTPMDRERARICTYLMDSITRMATKLPLHTVVPYRNMPAKDYPQNKPEEETVCESTCG